MFFTDVAPSILRTLLVILLFGLAGAPFAIVLFKAYAQRALIAPLAGLISSSIIVLATYNLLNVSFRASLAVAASLLVVFLIVALWQSRPTLQQLIELWRPLTLVVVTGTVCAAAVNMAEMVNGDYALPLLHGTDQVGYATNADWLLTHHASARPHLNPFDTGEIHSAYVFARHSRFVPFVGLATVATVTGVPTLFAYQTFCAATLAMGALALAAVVANRIRIIAVVTPLLLISYWFEYTYTGFLGKLIGYPVSIVAVIALLRHFDGDRPLALHGLGSVAALILLCGVPQSHSPAVTVLFVVAIVAPYWLLRTLQPDRPTAMEMLDQAAKVALCMIVFAAAYGVLSRYQSLTSFPRNNAPWGVMLAHALDLTPIMDTWLAIAVGAHATLATLAFFNRQALPAALAVGPAATLGIIYLLDTQRTAFQLTGFAYPTGICAVGILVDRLGSLHRSAITWTLIALVVVTLSSPRLPRFASALIGYATPTPDRTRIFLKREFEAIANTVRDRPFKITVDSPYHAVALLGAFERGTEDLQWGEEPWRWVGRYARVPLPTYREHATILIYRRGDPRALAQRTLLITPNFHVVE